MSSSRPILAIVTGHLTPYRIAFHRRIVTEIPGLQIASLVTKYRTGPWVNPDLPDIHTVRLDPDPPPGSHAQASMINDRGGRSLPAHLRHEFGTARRVRRWLGEHDPAAILCAGYDELPVLAAMHWGRRHGRPVFMSSDANIHGDLTAGWKRRIKNIYVPRVCARFSGIMVCGGAGRKFFRRYGVPDARLHVMPVEPDYAVIEAMTPERAAGIAGGLGLVPGRKRIVCCCRLIPVKRVDLVIAAFGEIAQQRADWDLIIVGKGDDQPALERQALPLATNGRVRFLGFQDATSLAAIYRSSQVLVLASDYEPWALVVNEAAAAGMAVVASDRVGAARELVRHGESGFIFPAGDLPRLTESLRDATDPARVDTLRRASLREIGRWRTEADPVKGLREVLRSAGVLPA